MNAVPGRAQVGSKDPGPRRVAVITLTYPDAIRRPLTQGVAMPAIAALPTWAIAASGHYLHRGVISVSIANLLIVIAMLVIFGLALVVPFPGHRTTEHPAVDRDEDGAS
jgi:hypothetical protein